MKKKKINIKKEKFICLKNGFCEGILKGFFFEIFFSAKKFFFA